MSYQVKLYINSSGEHHLNKAITHVADVDCEIKDPENKENPEIYITATDAYFGVNYIEIPAFNRFYYATPQTGRGQTITYICQSDVLMSFKGGIRTAPAVISRNPWHFDLYLNDNKMPIEARTASAVIKFPNNHFNGENNCYILTTLGG